MVKFQTRRLLLTYSKRVNVNYFLKILRIPSFYQILIHLLVGELSHGEVSDP